MGAALVLLLVGLGALAAGVLIGRYYVPDDRQLRRTARHGRAYMRALSHMVARDHEAAVAELRTIVEESVDDVEPYFALGAMFRSRGEHERAIRVHQALAQREHDKRKLRQRAMYELGLDFRAAGMPRRATRAMEEVLQDEPGHEGVLRVLAALYEEQARFNEAAGLWQRLGRKRGEDTGHREHHLLVAAAQAALGRGDLDSAKQLLKSARKHEETPHFFAAAAELAAARGNHRGAKERLQQALAADPGLAPYLLPGLIAAEQELAAHEASGERGKHDADDLDDDHRAAPAQLASGAPAQLASGAPAQLASDTSAPLASGAPAQLASGAPAQLVSGTSAPLASGTPAPLTSGTPAQLASGTPAPLGADTSAPLGAGTPAPLAATAPAPLAATETAPAAATPSPGEATAGGSLVLSPGRNAPPEAPAPASHGIASLAPGRSEIHETRLPEAISLVPSHRPTASVVDRVLAVLAEVGAERGPRLELALIRAQLVPPGDAAARAALASELTARFPGSLAARVATARLALASADPAAIRGALDGLVSDAGVLAWALRGRWQCSHCGHRPGPFSWRCGQCRRWSTLRMETGIEPPPVPPRERRAAPRVARADGLLGAAPDDALPAATLDAGLSDAELASAGTRRSLLGRVGGWASGLWRRGAS
jgi:lipopolysaccharide biosynthesis regulator YciM